MLLSLCDCMFVVSLNNREKQLITANVNVNVWLVSTSLFDCHNISGLNEFLVNVFSQKVCFNEVLCVSF